MFQFIFSLTPCALHVFIIEQTRKSADTYCSTACCLQHLIPNTDPFILFISGFFFSLHFFFQEQMVCSLIWMQWEPLLAVMQKASIVVLIFSPSWSVIQLLSHSWHSLGMSFMSFLLDVSHVSLCPIPPSLPPRHYTSYNQQHNHACKIFLFFIFISLQAT